MGDSSTPEPSQRGPIAEGWEVPTVPGVSKDKVLTNVAWSAEIVAQNLECLFLCLRDGEVRLLRPLHAPALRVGWRPDFEANDTVLAAARRYDLEAILVHSTSWRFEKGSVVLTYIVAVAPPTELNEYLVEEPVVRSDLARGSAFEPPPQIETAQVIEHACRHLAWLIKDDDEVAAAIPDWAAYLGTFAPEPFRSFGTPGT